MVVADYFLSPDKLLFLSFLAPLVLLYLIKPKPKRRTIPSLMFILNDRGKNRINRLFRNFVVDILLLFQFLTVLLVAAAIAQPYINVPQKLLVQDTILLIDVSASSNLIFNKIEDAALDNLADKNTIILIKDSPELIAEEVPASRAKKIIKDLKPTDTTSNIADAIKLATQFSGAGTNLVIISDFLPSAGSLDIDSQIKAVESMGALVTPIIISEPRPNLGIIDLLVRDTESKVWIKNYDNKPRDVTLQIGDKEEYLLMAKKETKELSFSTPAGVTEIKIKEKDDLMSDNSVFISTPADNNVDVLVITNNKEGFEKSNLKLAWDLIDKNFPINLDYDYAIPPKVHDLNHDLYIFYDVKPEFILPGVIKDIEERVNDGAGVIIFAQNNMFALDFRSLLAVSFENMGVSSEIIAEENSLTKDVDFSQVKKYFIVKADEGITTVAKAGESPVITLHKLGSGMVMYYGFFEGEESFSVENSFPVFWRRAINLLTNRPSLRNLNVRTGTLLSFPKEENIKTPLGKIKSQIVKADVAGLYVLEDRTIAVNMLSDLESNINQEAKLNKLTKETIEETEKKVPKDLTKIFLILGSIIMLFETFYMKLRGDL